MVLPARIYQLAGAKRPCWHGSKWPIVSVERGDALVKKSPDFCCAEHGFLFRPHRPWAIYGPFSIRPLGRIPHKAELAKPSV